MSSISLKFKIYFNKISMSIIPFELVRYHIWFSFCRPLNLDTSGVFKKIDQYSKLNNFCIHYQILAKYMSFERNFSCHKNLQNIKTSFILKYPENGIFIFSKINAKGLLLLSQNFEMGPQWDQKFQQL